MPEETRRRAGGVSGRAAPALALGLFLLASCLNLDVPNVPATPVPPSLSIASPRTGDTISLSQQVSVAAASVYGISSVSVLCGPLDGGAHTVFTWSAAPYLAPVSFGVCQDVTQQNPDGGDPLLQITVFALSDAGAVQDAGITVFLDSRGPDLLVQYPPTAQPKSSFTVTVSADIELRSIPEVSLGGTPPDSIGVLPNPDGGMLPVYSALFKSTPGLGTDNLPYTKDVPVPIEALTDTDETVRLTVSGTALNGNTTELDLSVDLTRVVWDRYIPGQPASSSPKDWAAEPLAFSLGLLLPLATSSPATSASNWLPGLMAAYDGTFYGADASPLDAGYLARAFNSQGQTLFVNFNGSSSKYLLAPPPGMSTPPPVTSTNEPLAAPPLTRVDNLLCLQDGVTGCSEEALESLECFDASLHPVTASGGGPTGPPVAGVVAGAGGRYLSPVQPVCDGSWNLVDLGTGTVSFGPLADPNGIGACTVTGVLKLFAVGDGTFVVQLSEACGTVAPLPPEFPILRVGANSTILGAYTAPQGTPFLVKQEVVGVLSDGRVVTLSNAPPFTNFQLWSLNSASPDVTTPITGLYDSADALLPSVLALSSYSGVDGSFAVLLSNNATFGAAVMAFGPELQPRWLYVYPRVTSATTVRLVSAPAIGDVYLVDEFNNRAVSLRVVPLASGPDAGQPSVEPGIYVTQGNDSVEVFSLTATGNVPPMRTLVGTQTGLSLPVGIQQDSQGNLYVANRTGSTVTVYPPLASGNVSPTRTLTASGMSSPQGLAVAVGDDIYVSTCPNCGPSAGGQTAVFHFPAQSTASDYSIAGESTDLFYPGNIALGDNTPGVGQVLYVANSFGDDVVTYSPHASGNVAPFSTFNPLDDGANIQSMAYGASTLFIGIPNVGVGLFPSDSTGVPNPSSSLEPEGFVYPGGVAVDTSVTPPVVYLVDFSANALYVIHTTGTPPNLSVQSVTTISGPATGLDEPLGILVVK
jgi:hypothetical protein